MASIAVFIHAYLANENWSSNYKPLANDSFKIIISFLHYTLTVHGLDKLHLETILKVGVYQSKLYHMQLQKNYILYFSVEVISSIVLSSVPRKGNRTHLNMLLFSDVIHSIPLHIPGIQLIHPLLASNTNVGYSTRFVILLHPILNQKFYEFLHVAIVFNIKQSCVRYSISNIVANSQSSHDNSHFFSPLHETFSIMLCMFRYLPY